VVVVDGQVSLQGCFQFSGRGEASLLDQISNPANPREIGVSTSG
jgi:hypothetical protein